jgi:5-amino-6-(5-phosphoribosylamino)uracil reductase
LVTLVMAMSADGKIAPMTRTAPRFGTADRRRLERLCADADALVMGAGTLRAHGTTVPIRSADLLDLRRSQGRADQPLTCVVTRSGAIDADLRFFRQPVPRAFATTAAGAAELRPKVGDLAQVWVCGEDEVTPESVLAKLAELGMHRVALLGGGELNAAWVAAGCVDRIELSIAPRLFGAAAAPTPLDGPGLPAAVDLTLTGVEEADGCLFLSYRVRRP